MIALENPPSMIVLLQRLSIALHFVCKLEGCDSQIIFGIPSVYLAMENHQFFRCKSSISGPCSIAMLDYQRLSPTECCFLLARENANFHTHRVQRLPMKWMPQGFHWPCVGRLMAQCTFDFREKKKKRVLPHTNLMKK